MKNNRSRGDRPDKKNVLITRNYTLPPPIIV